jgi:undecaprenyl-diphosphatase
VTAIQGPSGVRAQAATGHASADRAGHGSARAPLDHAAEPRPMETLGQRVRGLRASRFQLALLIATLTFGILAYLAHATPYWAFDLAVTRAIQAIDVPLVGMLLGAIGWIGFPPQFPILCAAIVVGLFLLRRPREAWTLMADAAAACALWFTTTRLIDRPRPDAALVGVAGEVHGGSFPSGHVLTNVAIFGLLVFLAYAGLRPSWYRTLLMAVCAVPIVFVGVARIYAGHHWPSDVLGGYMLGGLLLAVVIHLYRTRVQPHTPPLDSDEDGSA